MKILVPVDGSKNSLKALKYAINLANSLNSSSTITVVSVHDDASFYYIDQFASYEEIRKILIENSQTELKPAQKLLANTDIKHSFIIEIGNVSETIINIANKEKVSLIVLGSRGKSEISDVLLGSVSNRVSHKAKQPVLIVK